MTPGMPGAPEVYLRPAGPGDAGRIAAFKRDPLVKQMALVRGPDATQEGELSQILQARDSDSEDYFVIVDATDDHAVGYIRLNWMERERTNAWLRFALGERRGQGLARAALSGLFTRLFGEGTHRIDAEVYTINERSLGLLTGLGFVREGLKREAHFDGETYSDIIALGLLSADFEGARHA